MNAETNAADEAAKPERAPKTFLQTLAELQFGHFSDHATKQLRELIIAVAKTEKGGSLTLNMKLKPGKGGQVEVFAEVSTKLPKEERGSSIMFISPELNLQRNDPRQMELSGLRAVDKPATELRELPKEAPAPLRTVTA